MVYKERRSLMVFSGHDEFFTKFNAFFDQEKRRIHSPHQ